MYTRYYIFEMLHLLLQNKEENDLEEIEQESKRELTTGVENTWISEQTNIRRVIISALIVYRV